MLAEQILENLREHGPATVEGLACAMGTAYEPVYRSMRDLLEGERVQVVGPAIVERGGISLVYALREETTASRGVRRGGSRSRS